MDRKSRDYGTFGYDLVWLFGYVWERVRFLFKAENWSVLRYSVRNVSNWYRLVFWRLGFKTPFQTKIGNNIYTVQSEKDYLLVVELLKLYVQRFRLVFPSQNEVSFSYGGREITLEFGSIPRHQVLGLLQKFAGSQKWFSVLDVKDRVVVDIGANIGDTPIYFYLNGARRVVALEPDPTFYSLAIRNVSRNIPDADIVLLDQAAGKPGNVKVKVSPPDTIGYDLKVTDVGKEVRVRNLDELVKEYSIRDGILKVICVGCEVDLFEHSSDDSLKAFNQILIFSWYGTRWLSSRLKRCGFKVRILERHYTYSNYFKSRYIEGVLYATKRLTLR